MTGRYEPQELERRHECGPPGALSRWLHRVTEGRVWHCGCGRFWRWEVPHLATWPRWIAIDLPMGDVFMPPPRPLRPR